jgi:hypothetical protein
MLSIRTNWARDTLDSESAGGDNTAANNHFPDRFWRPVEAAFDPAVVSSKLCRHVQMLSILFADESDSFEPNGAATSGAQ